MKDEILLKSSSHLLISIFSTKIFGQENGRTTHFHLGDLIVDNTMGLGQERVKWEEWKSSTSMLEPPWRKRRWHNP
jgi:hypothetical protein